MTLIAIFLMVFVAGPLIFRAMIRPPATPGMTRFLACCAFGCAAAALALRYGMAQRWGADMLMTGAGVLLIWLGWISVLAFGTQALRQADPHRIMRQMTAVIGAAGTTIPWFGLAWASYAT